MILILETKRKKSVEICNLLESGNHLCCSRGSMRLFSEKLGEKGKEEIRAERGRWRFNLDLGSNGLYIYIMAGIA